MSISTALFSKLGPIGRICYSYLEMNLWWLLSQSHQAIFHFFIRSKSEYLTTRALLTKNLHAPNFNTKSQCVKQQAENEIFSLKSSTVETAYRFPCRGRKDRGCRHRQTTMCHPTGGHPLALSVMRWHFRLRQLRNLHRNIPL